jgi:hypothetical protein
VRHQTIKPLLFLVFALLVLTPTISASAQDVEKVRQENLKTWAALDTDRNQRKAIINDLIDTYNACFAALAKLSAAKGGSAKYKYYSQQTEQCYETLWAKIDRTPLDVLTPFSSVGKGVDLLETKKAAFFRLYDAYEYGAENPKPGSVEPKP